MDSNTFIQAFNRVENNPELSFPERDMTVVIPVAAIPKGYEWEKVGNDLLTWFESESSTSSDGRYSGFTAPVGLSGKTPLSLSVVLQAMHAQGLPGVTMIARGSMLTTLSTVVEEALSRKIPELAHTVSAKHILLIERQL